MKLTQYLFILALFFVFSACQNSTEQQSDNSETILGTSKIAETPAIPATDTKIEKAPLLSDAAIEQLLIKHYPERKNTRFGKCHCGEAEKDFCYTLNIAHKYDFQDNTNKAIVILGATIGGDDCPKDEGVAHAAAGWVDGIVFEHKDLKWTVVSVAKNIGGGGGWGDWGSIGQVQYFAKNSPVISIETGFTGQGVTNGSVDLIGLIGNKMQNIGTIQNYTDNSGAAFDESKAECFCIAIDFEDNGGKYYDMIALKKDCKEEMETAEGCAGKTLKQTSVKFDGKKYALGKDFELW